MHVKTYMGKSTQSILAQIKEELGPEAVILSNRTLRRGGERFYEVTAGVERNPLPGTMAPAAGASKSTAKAAYTNNAAAAAAQEAEAKQAIMASQRVKQMASQVMESGQFSDIENPPASPISRPSGQVAGRAPSQEMPSLRSLREQGRTTRPRSLSHTNAPVTSVTTNYNDHQSSGWNDWHKEWLQIKDHLFALMKPSMQMDKLTARQRVALEYLQREGVSDAVILELYRRLLAAPGESVLESLGNIVTVIPWNEENWQQRIHCFAGPFGVGKTTSALRMALQLRSKDPSLRIAFINADCQRGNGRLILRHWAELSDFSYSEAADAQSMKRALVNYAHLDKIFIDLPSLTSGETLSAKYAELGLEGDEAGSKSTHVVLAPSYDGAQLLNFLQRYTPDGSGSIVWSKLDEAMSYGALVNAAANCYLPVSALSFGAELRGTLASASESLLWRLIFKRQLPSAGQTQNA